MINCLVTIGSHDQDFSRLIQYCIDFSHASYEEFRFIYQYGFTDVSNLIFREGDVFFDFADRDCFSKLISSVDCVITHAGIGTINDSIDMGFFPIIVPRLVSKHEHTDPSQLPVCEYFVSIGKAFGFTELPTFHEFEEKIQLAVSLKKDPSIGSWRKIKNLIAQDISYFAGFK